MQKTCKQCSAAFEITSEDLQMLQQLSPVIGEVKLELPPPTHCPDCRLQRRMACVNQLNMYQRKCDISGASIISNIHPSSPYKVYRQEDWYSDKWDPLTYGRDFDFSRPFFEQIQELTLAVPRPNLFTGFEFDDNCSYTNHSGKNKDCYLIFDSDENRDCYYSYSVNKCQNCLDCFRVRKSELCYECIDCVQCYSSAYLHECDNCSDSLFLKNCTGCKHCLMCSNLKNKEYYIENKPVSPEEFHRIRALLEQSTNLRGAQERFAKLKLEYPQKFLHGMQNENVSGDYLVRSKNAYRCFDCEDLWDCRYTYQAFMPLKNCMDIQECGDAELLYECSVAGYGLHQCLFCHHTLATMSNMIYCSLTHHSKNCFGCIGTRRKEYCILNKQYSQQEYEALVPKIVAHMQKTGEWGEYFPIATSTYGYNESLSQDYYPLTEEQVRKKGWKWLSETEQKQQYLGPKVAIPETAAATPALCKEILTCETSAKQYKLIPQELKFLQSLRLPLPRKAFIQRHKDRMALRNPRKLWNRQCAKCQATIETTYAPDRPEIVYCEKCYLSTVY